MQAIQSSSQPIFIILIPILQKNWSHMRLQLIIQFLTHFNFQSEIQFKTSVILNMSYMSVVLLNFKIPFIVRSFTFSNCCYPLTVSLYNALQAFQQTFTYFAAFPSVPYWFYSTFKASNAVSHQLFNMQHSSSQTVGCHWQHQAGQLLLRNSYCSLDLKDQSGWNAL